MSSRKESNLTSIFKSNRILSILFLFSGIALLGQILFDLSLTFGLVLTLIVFSIAFARMWRTFEAERKKLFFGVLKIGLVIGVISTINYDVTKYLLSQLDPSPYNPFEAGKIFGMLLVGETAPASLIQAAGIGFHLLNGITFAVAYCFLLGNRGIWTGAVWGLGLELFQLTLYPGWLDIRFYQEFAQISAISHLVYGISIGYLCKRWLSNLTTEGQTTSKD